MLQEYSTLDPDEPGDATNTIAAARALTKVVHDRNPNVDVSLVATWTRPDLTFPAGKHWSGQPVERMALDLRRADEQVRKDAPSITRVIPVGEAFNCAIRRGIADPDPYDGVRTGEIDLWAADHYHASTEGYYLEALTIFAAVTGMDTRKLGGMEGAAVDLAISRSVARKLQGIAFEIVKTGRCGAN